MHIWIIGYMGAGKTFTAERLGKTLGTRVLDTDTYIEQNTGCAVSTIFNKHGESYFRVLERQVCLELSHDSEPAIISTGGGLPVESFGIEEMKTTGPVLFLNTDLDIMWARVVESGRPLASDRSSFEERYESRKPVYESADLIVDPAECDITCVVRLLKDMKSYR